MTPKLSKFLPIHMQEKNVMEDGILFIFLHTIFKKYE